VNGKPLLHPDDPHIVAIASDVPLPQSPLPVISIDDIPAIAAFIIGHCGLQPSETKKSRVSADVRD